MTRDNELEIETITNKHHKKKETKKPHRCGMEKKKWRKTKT